jgi:hypothetical protein
VATITDRPTRVGKLKIGEKTLSKNGKEIPSKLDYIKAVDGAGNRIEAFHATYGDKPTEFRAVFPSNDPDEFWWEAYRRYGSGTGLACHGDGRNAIVEETGETIECPCQFAEGDRPSCKPVGSLSLFVYEVPALGVFQVDTGGINSIRNIRWFLHALQGLSGGQYQGIPFRVYVEPFQALHDGKASTAYAWKMDLLPGMAPADVRLAAAEAVDSFLLPPGVRAEIDEAKPEDLYVGIPASTDSEAALEALTQPETVPDGVAEAEEAFMTALAAADLTPGKNAAALAAANESRHKAEETGNWDGYVEWLHRQAEKFAPVEGTLL